MKGWLDKYEYGGQAGYTDIPFKYNSAWGGQFEDGGDIPQAQDGWLKKLERKVGESIGKPMNRGVNYSIDAVKNKKAKEEDTLRHAYSAMETNKAIQDKTGNIPFISSKLGFLGANALGVGHELIHLFQSTPDEVRESGEDIINNFVGSLAGSIPFVSDENKRKAIQYLSDKGILPDGTTAARGRKYDVINKNKKYAMGGSIPGAVGFTYARTGGIPSNGPYAKKTKASAQDGEIVSQTDPEVEQARQSMFDFYSNRPANLSGDIASEAVQNVNIEEIPLERLQKQNAYGLYYPDTNTVGYNNQMVTLEGYDPYDELQILEHEIGHSVYESLPKNEQQIIEESIITPKEFRERWPKGEISRNWSKYVTKPTEFYTRRNRMFDVFGIDPSQPITDEKAQEMIDFRKWMGSSTSSEEKAELLKNHPNFNKYLENYESSENKSEISDFMNSIKNDVPTYKRVFNEVTAVPGEQLPIAQNGMTYYQHGLDWKPKSISRNGGWLDKYTPKAQVGEIVGPYQSAANSNDVKISLVPTLGQTTSEVAPSGFNYEDYYNKAGKYLSRPTFKNTELKPEHIAKSAQEFYEKTGYEYPLDLLLTQAQMETGLGTKLKSKHNYFNVGNTDSGAVKNYETPQQSLLEYMGVMYNDYLQKGKKKVTDLLKPKGFVNYAGNRYASAPDYEKKLLAQKNFIAKKLSLKKGGVIKDDMGQWAHPGEITEIGSNQITMQGVPYPVLGISDAGDTQMMYPEQEYKFKGKKVTEIPLNKKSTGGWLDKYN